jgi:RND superfamily putative drug exporter
VTRAREEARTHGTREASCSGVGDRRRHHQRGRRPGRGVLRTGVLPPIVLTQLGIIVGLGILLDTFLVRTVVIWRCSPSSGRRCGGPAS